MGMGDIGAKVQHWGGVSGIGTIYTVVSTEGPGRAEARGKAGRPLGVNRSACDHYYVLMGSGSIQKEGGCPSEVSEQSTSHGL